MSREIARRVRRIQKAMMAGNYIDDDEVQVRDVLADLRHYCDALDIDFADEDRIAHDHYLAEREAAAS